MTELRPTWDRIELLTDDGWRDAPYGLDFTLVRYIGHDDRLETAAGGVIVTPWRAWSGNTLFASGGHAAMSGFGDATAAQIGEQELEQR